MLLEHDGKSPEVHPEAWVAPTATLCGAVSLGPGTRIMHGAQVIADGGAIVIGANCIVMENAVVRATARHSARIGDHCLIGPNAHVVGARVEDEVFIATGAAVFHASRIGRGSVVRIHGVVHLKTVLPPDSTVPIAWVAVGDPAAVLPPDDHEGIWAIQERLKFFLEVYGLDRSDSSVMRGVTAGLSERLGAHRHDRTIEAPPIRPAGSSGPA